MLITGNLSNTTDCIIFHCATVVTFDAEFEQDCPPASAFSAAGFFKVKLPRCFIERIILGSVVHSECIGRPTLPIRGHRSNQKSTGHDTLSSRYMALLHVFATAILLLLSGFAASGYAEPNKVQYELQERCAKGASEFFQKEYGNGIEDNGGGGETYTYFVNHYNARLNKCFISFTRYAFFPKNSSKTTAKF